MKAAKPAAYLNKVSGKYQGKVFDLDVTSAEFDKSGNLILETKQHGAKVFEKRVNKYGPYYVIRLGDDVTSPVYFSGPEKTADGTDRTYIRFTKGDGEARAESRESYGN
jgi:hypothetical protein